MSSDHANWIDGQWRPARGEHEFEVAFAGDPGAAIERWPRSGPADLEVAIESAQRASRGWRALGPAARALFLENAARLLSTDPDPGDAVARRLGLAASEIARHHAPLAGSAAFVRGRIAVPDEPSAAAGLLLFAPHWSELWCEPVRCLISALASGQTAIWLADRHLPWIAETVALALGHAGLPHGVFAVLHDDSDACLRAALEAPGIDAVDASGPAAALRRLERLVHRARPPAQQRAHRAQLPTQDRELAPAHALEGAQVFFGAGLENPWLENRVPPTLALRVLRNRSYVVGPNDDPALAAREVVEHAFGRAVALSGQGPGQVGRVLCVERAFSRFTAALLAELDHDPGVARPIPFVEPATAVHLRRASELGLDEGATPIFGPGPTGPTRPATDEDDLDPGTSPPARGRARLSPIVFTNVEEHMRLAWLGRPAPVLSLLRVESDAEGRALAAQLDPDPLAEDLSGEPDEAI